MPETNLSFSHLDSPAPGAALPQGRHTLRGWVWPKAGGHFVDVRARIGELIFPGVHGLPRADLALHFQTGRPVALAEFDVVVDLVPGPAEVVLEALELAGCWTAFRTIRYEVGPASPPAEVATPSGPLRSHEYGRALRTLLITHAHQSVRPLTDVARAFVAQLPLPRDLRQPHAPFHGHLDEPASLANCHFGRVSVQGFLFHETLAIKRVLATFDLQAWQTIEHGLTSPGPGASHSPFAQAGQCGIFGVIDLAAQLPEPVCLRLYAELADGSLHLCFVQRFLPSAGDEGKQPYPALSPVLFLRAVKALRAALKERDAVVEAGSAGRREIWRQWRDYVRQAPRRRHAVPAALPDAPTTTLSDQPLGRVMLFTHNLDYEGAPLLFLEYARHLVKHGGAHLTVASGKEGPLRAQFSALGAEVRIVDVATLGHAETPRAWREAFRQLRQQVDCAAADLIVANTLASYWAVHLAHQAGRASVFYIHESTTPAAFQANHGPKGMLSAMEAALGLATRVSFNTAHTSRYYEPFAQQLNYRHNPGWIDLAAIDTHRRETRREDLRRALGLPDGRRLVCNLGTVCERKGQHIFARAVDLLWRTHPETAAGCEFWMVGGRASAFDAALTDLLIQLDRPNLRIIPETTRAYDYLGAADLFVCSSYEESFPRVVLEAMALEVPIISSAVHGVPEMVTHEKEALLVAPGNTSALANAIARILLDAPLAGELARQARRRVERNFAASVILPRQVDLAHEAISAHHTKP